jgi:hypothetical protein
VSAIMRYRGIFEKNRVCHPHCQGDGLGSDMEASPTSL